MLRDSFTDVRAQSSSIRRGNVLVDVAPNTCGCELGIMNRSMKCAWLGCSRSSEDLVILREKWIRWVKNVKLKMTKCLMINRVSSPQSGMISVSTKLCGYSELKILINN